MSNMALSEQQSAFFEYLLDLHNSDTVITTKHLQEAAEYAAYNGLDWYKLITARKIAFAISQAGIMLPKVIYDRLTEKDYFFVSEYMKDFDKNQAAIRSGHEAHQGTTLKNKPGVVLEIERRQKDLKDLSQITAARVLLEYARIGFADLTDFVEFEDGKLTLRDSCDVDGRILEEVTQGPNGIKIKLHSKMKALDSISRTLGLFNDKIELTGKGGKDLIDTNPIEQLLSELDVIGKNIAESSKNIENKNQIAEATKTTKGAIK